MSLVAKTGLKESDGQVLNGQDLALLARLLVQVT